MSNEQKQLQHTPGPWEVYNYIGRIGLTRVRAVVGKDRTRRNTYVDIPDSPEDARLIAAAPDLLAACEAALTQDSVSPDCEEIYNQLRDAIEKAIGG